MRALGTAINAASQPQPAAVETPAPGARYASIIVGDPDKKADEQPELFDAFEFRDNDAREGFKDWFGKQDDAYSRCVFVFAARWARAMENVIAERGLTPEQVTPAALGEFASQSSHVADNTPRMGISGFMYGAAVSVLYQAWRYGDVLRRWSNNDLGRSDLNDSGDGVANPALITVSLPE